MDAATIVGLILLLLVVAFFVIRLRITAHTKCKSQERLDGKVVLITGATSGIGKATAMKCAERGAILTVACRDKRKAEAAVTRIRRKTSNANVQFLPLDLSSFQSVREFVDIFVKQYDHIDVIINNAAYMGPKSKTADGMERTFQVNYLSHFLLTNLLIEKCKPNKSKPLRIVNLLSDSYCGNAIDFDDFTYSKTPYNIYQAYGRSKLALVLFTLEFSYKHAGSGIIALAVNPGATLTGLTANWPGIGGSVLRFAAKLFFRSPEAGAESVLHCAVAENGADYVGRIVQDCKCVPVATEGRNFKCAERLWDVSLSLTELESGASVSEE